MTIKVVKFLGDDNIDFGFKHVLGALKVIAEITNEDGEAIKTDDMTNALTVIDYAHHEIHSGSHFKAGYQDTVMATNDEINILFITPDTLKWAHFELTAQATGAVIIDFYEDAVVSANGTLVTAWNRNRNSTKVNTVLVYHTPTVTTNGTKISSKWVGNEGFKDSVGGEARGEAEFILKQNTKYLIKLTAVSNNIKGAVGGDWYEHTDLT